MKIPKNFPLLQFSQTGCIEQDNDKFSKNKSVLIKYEIYACFGKIYFLSIFLKQIKSFILLVLRKLFQIPILYFSTRKSAKFIFSNFREFSHIFREFRFFGNFWLGTCHGR
jgi:hypothetical protein